MKFKKGMRVRYENNRTGTIVALKGDTDPWFNNVVEAGVVIVPDDKRGYRHTRFEKTGSHWTTPDVIEEVLHDPSMLDDSLFEL